MKARRPWLWVVLLAAVVAVSVLTVSRRRTGPPLDPRSTSGNGAAALVEFLEASGVDVDVTAAVPDVGAADTVLVLGDRMPAEQASDVRRYVAAGGTLVVADAHSSLTPASETIGARTVTGPCSDGSLGDVVEIDVSESAGGFIVGPDLDVICFRDGHTAFVVSASEGHGTVIGVGDPNVFANDHLDRADNAVLAEALLGGDGTRLTLLTPAPDAVGAGSQSLWDLVPVPLKTIGFQVLIAFGFVIWWKGRRLGAPVPEPQPVSIDGSELTRAVGHLLEANDRPDRAAALLRDRARTELSPILGLSTDAPSSAVAAAIARASTLSDAEIRVATVAPVVDDQQLLVVSQLLTRISEEVEHDNDTPAGRP